MENVGCEYRKMFGYPAYFLNGNLLIGILEKKLYLRLPRSDIEMIRRENPEVVPFEPMPGRAMKNYIVLPKSLYSNDKMFAEWLNRSIIYVSLLPPKQGKNGQRKKQSI